MDFWDTGNGHPSVSLANSDKGHGSFLFDPRCLGLAPYLSQGNSVDACLGYVGTKSISLMGQEIVEGVLTWHVRVGEPSDIHLNFWIDVAYPGRVVRHSSNGKTAASRYDESDPGNPIPAEVQIYDDRASGLRITQRLLQTGHDLNSSVEETLFTLAGLGMPVGTVVTDVRKMRSMGYWNGTALSEELPAKTDEEPLPPPSLTDQLAFLEKSPESPEALEAAIWIVLNNPDGPAVNTALEVIQSHHIRASGLLTLCREQERVRHRGSKALLESLLRENPDASIRGTACFVLATLHKDEAKFGQNVNATVAAVQYFERTLAEFGTVTWNGSPVADLAKLELGELRRLSLGQPAPEIVGVDLEGLPMRLSEFRGRVIVLVFWWNKFSEAQEIRKLAEMFPAESFSVVGVFGGRDLEAGRSEAEQRGMTWRSFWDSRDGPIAKEWNVRGWPDVWVLDRQVVIRHRDLRGPELRSAVERLLKE